MSEMVVPLMGTLIGCFSGGVFTYALAKRYLSDEKICQKVNMILEEITENPDMQQKLYVFGGILGKGIRDGVGIEKMIPKRRGGLEGIILELIGGFIGNKLGASRPQEQEMQVLQPQEANRFG